MVDGSVQTISEGVDTSDYRTDGAPLPTQPGPARPQPVRRLGGPWAPGPAARSSAATTIEPPAPRRPRPAGLSGERRPGAIAVAPGRVARPERPRRPRSWFSRRCPPHVPESVLGTLRNLPRNGPGGPAAGRAAGVGVPTLPARSQTARGSIPPCFPAVPPSPAGLLAAGLLPLAAPARRAERRPAEHRPDGDDAKPRGNSAVRAAAGVGADARPADAGRPRRARRLRGAALRRTDGLSGPQRPAAGRRGRLAAEKDRPEAGRAEGRYFARTPAGRPGGRPAGPRVYAAEGRRVRHDRPRCRSWSISTAAGG